MHIYTIGYEGLTLQTFLLELQAQNIRCILDVRQIPLSRKRGFSKKQLATALAEQRIQYKHYSELGSPAEARAQVRKDHNYKKLFAACRKAYKTADAKHAFAQLQADASEQRSALLCFCAEPTHCHRMVLTEMLEAAAHQVTHIRTQPLKTALQS